MESPLVWIDLEMTGLDPEEDTILEIATIVTDENLKIIAEGPNLVIHTSKERLDAMDEWCTTHHEASGLTARVLASTMTMAEAEAITLDFVKKHTKARTSPLCGNSIHQDRRFLVKYMPELNDYLHYRLVDVSTVKELVKRWYPEHKHRGKKGGHRALADIRESIDELKHYRDTVFKDGKES